MYGAPREMDWLNLHTSTLDSPQFIGCDPIDRATWLCLLRYCAGQENGGVISDCQDWTDRKWQQCARVTFDEVRRLSALWEWKAGTLHVWAYPKDKEELVKTLRVRGKDAAKKRWGEKIVGPKKKKGNPYVNGINGGSPLIPEKSPRLDPKNRAASDEVPD